MRTATVIRLRFMRGLNQSGTSLVEAVVVVAILMIVGVAALSGLSTAHSSSGGRQAQMTAEMVARNQLEDVFVQPYQVHPANYPLVTPPSGFSVSVVTAEYVPGDSNIEKIVVTVFHGQEQVLAVETLRTK